MRSLAEPARIERRDERFEQVGRVRQLHRYLRHQPRRRGWRNRAICYESRLARIELDEDEKPKIDAEIADLTEDEAQSEQERLKRKWASVEALVGAKKRIALVAEDLVKHFEARNEALDSKAMIVCMSRRICAALYDASIKLTPPRPAGVFSRRAIASTGVGFYGASGTASKRFANGGRCG